MAHVGVKKQVIGPQSLCPGFRPGLSHLKPDGVKLAQQGLHPVLARLVSARGLADPRELTTTLDALIAPAALTQVDKAATFLADAIDAGKRMVVVADYDCDGATACSVAIRGLRAMGATVDYIVPNRFEYGYGLTPEIVTLAQH